jgi:myosin V
LNVEGANAARDVLAKTTYDLLFRSVLQAVNFALAVEDQSEETASFIGVLDIFGFEYFQKNR